MTQERNPDIPGILFTVFVVAGLLVAMLWIMGPFLLALVWATLIVIPTWPVMLGLQKRLGNKRGLAVAIMTLVLLAVVFVPVVGGVVTVASSADEIQAKIATLKDSQLPPPPAWVAGVPVVGVKAAAKWQSMSGSDFVDVIGPYSRSILGFIKSRLGAVGGALLQCILTVIVASVLYSNGEAAADRTIRFARRLGGTNGESAVVLAGKTVKSIAMGVVVTAVLQTIACGIGLAIAGVPFAGILTVVIFILCIAQIGPMLVLLPAVIWTFGTGETGWGIFLLVWSVVFGLMDNVLRPILIKKGVDLPLLLIFAGVIGGLLTLGLLGIFVGPVILAVTWELLRAWIDRTSEVEPAPA